MNLTQITTIKSWDELQKAFTLEEVKSALRHKEQQRLYHKKQYLKRQAVMDRVKEEHPEWFESK